MTEGSTPCPVCGCERATRTITRDTVPTLQNYVYAHRSDAIRAPQGKLDLLACQDCGFVWNAAFDPRLAEYLSGYDNAVPSSVSAEYYRQIARYLRDRYDLENGHVVDIGCGNGAFLKTLADVVPGCRGLGVDPALPSDSQAADGRVVLRKGLFSADAIHERPSLVVCRHVLEHIAQPLPFVHMIRTALSRFPSVPVFIEVPDLDWILENATFWDFCYEHCNYFTEQSLRALLVRGGLHPTATRAEFGGQYRWIEADTRGGVPSELPTESGSSKLLDYARDEHMHFARARKHIEEVRGVGRTVVVWGMATKGVVFTLLVDPDMSLVNVSVDINQNKQGKYVPLSGRRIDSPEVLRDMNAPLAVVVMNPNYAAEIRSQCHAFGVTAEFMDASGRSLSHAT